MSRTKNKPPSIVEMKFGEVCAGWSSKAWASELRRKAKACAAWHADMAKRYEEWANELDPRNKK